MAFHIDVFISEKKNLLHDFKKIFPIKTTEKYIETWLRNDMNRMHVILDEISIRCRISTQKTELRQESKTTEKKPSESSHTNESRNPAKWIMPPYFSPEACKSSCRVYVIASTTGNTMKNSMCLVVAFCMQNATFEIKIRT